VVNQKTSKLTTENLLTLSDLHKTTTPKKIAPKKKVVDHSQSQGKGRQRLGDSSAVITARRTGVISASEL